MSAPLKPPVEPRGLQWVWWGRWIGFGRTRDYAGLGRIYRWRIRLGLFEVRRWKRGRLWSRDRWATTNGGRR